MYWELLISNSARVSSNIMVCEYDCDHPASNTKHPANIFMYKLLRIPISVRGYSTSH